MSEAEQDQTAAAEAATAPAAEAPAAEAPEEPAEAPAAEAPEEPDEDANGKIAELEVEAKAAADAAYEAYNVGHGRRPAANAGELLAKAAQAAAALAAAKRG